MPKIADAENLRLAFWKAAKGKRGKADCLAFRERLDENLAALGKKFLWEGAQEIELTEVDG